MFTVIITNIATCKQICTTLFQLSEIVNGLRSNYSYTMIPGAERRFGTCDIEMSNRKAEPPENVRINNISACKSYLVGAGWGQNTTNKKGTHSMLP